MQLLLALLWLIGAVIFVKVCVIINVRYYVLVWLIFVVFRKSSSYHPVFFFSLAKAVVVVVVV